jgi:hypothetical protein
LYPRALDYGIQPQEFWEFSLLELTDKMQSFQRVQESKLKEKIADQCRLSKILVLNIDRYLNKTDSIQPWDLYPNMFEVEKAFYEEQMIESQLAEYKERRRAYASEMNKKRHIGEEV